MGKRGIRYVINDSWEAGTQNWTDTMIADFTRLRGYDPHPWLPVLAGHVVESAQASDQFLWDLRKTIADLTATEHYGQLEATLKERGMGHYGESHESGRAFIADGMEVKKYNDIPDERDVGPGAGRQQGAVQLRCGRSRVGFGGAYLRAESGRGGVDDGANQQRVGVVAGDVEADGGPGAGQRHQPDRDSRIGPPAAGGQGAGADARDRMASGSTATKPGRSRRARGWTTWRAAVTCCSRDGLPRTCSTSTAKTRTSRRSS